jgi:hypothetical protein
MGEDLRFALRKVSGSEPEVPIRPSESHEELRLIDKGTLAVTNQRLVFVGKFRTVNVKLNKIVGVDVYQDALGLHFEGKEKTRYFQPKFSGTVDFKDEDLAYSVPFEAPLLKACIDKPSFVRNIEKARVILGPRTSNGSLGGVDSRDSLLRANQIQGFFLGGSLGCDGSFGFERRGLGANGTADHRPA